MSDSNLPTKPSLLTRIWSNKVFREVGFIVLAVGATFVITNLWVTNKDLSTVAKLSAENAQLTRYVRASEYYTKMAKSIWGKKAGRCDVGLIALADDAIKENKLDSVVTMEMCLAIMTVESGFNTNAVSSTKARGLMQIEESTARHMQKDIKVDDLFNEQVNVRLGTRELGRLMKTFDNDHDLAMLAYNHGPNAKDLKLLADNITPHGYSTKVKATQMLSILPPQ